MPHLDRIRVTAAAAPAALALAVLLLWLVRPSDAPSVPGADRVRQYADVRACLLTGSRGVAGPGAAAAWAGMERASGSTRTIVSYLPVPGRATTASALPYLASLVQRQCAVIVAVGDAQVAAVNADAGRFASVHFIAISRFPVRPGVVRVSPTASGVDSAVAAAVSTALGG